MDGETCVEVLIPGQVDFRKVEFRTTTTHAHDMRPQPIDFREAFQHLCPACPGLNSFVVASPLPKPLGFNSIALLTLSQAQKRTSACMPLACPSFISLTEHPFQPNCWLETYSLLRP
eukprot:1159963-Pelagomonas_calceolata.AAC.6